MKKKRGQVLVLVLLVVVVALAVGLSVASRNLTNLRTTTQTEQSQRAFNAAEGGIESILPNLATVAEGPQPAIQVGNLEANVTVNKETEYFWTIPEGEVGQVKLDDATGSPTEIQIEWVKTGDPQEDPTPPLSGTPASVEITRIDETAGNFTQQRFALTGGSAGVNEQGFDSPSNCSADFVKCTKIGFPSNSRILRIRPFWNQATVKVTSVGGSLPDQQYTITSSATSELGLTRKIEVTKTVLPQLPAVFDYVLYSERDIVK